MAIEIIMLIQWKHEGTPYEKEISPVGSPAEFVDGPDPAASDVVVKITRRKLAEAKNAD